MPTFKIDDCFAQHPKVIELLERERGGEAIALWTLAGSYCARYLTDGYITRPQLRRIGLDLELADLLVEVGLWEEGDTRTCPPGTHPPLSPGESPGGYTFRDWDKWNESKADVESRRERDRAKKRKQREKQELSPRDTPPHVPRGLLDRIGKVKELDLDVLDGAERQTIPAPPVRTTWQRVGKLYRERYLEAKRGKVLDYHIQAHVQQWEDLARLVDGYEDPIAACEQALDGFFGDSWVKSKDYPPSALVKQFGKYYDPPPPPAVKPEDEPDPEAVNARRIRERRLQEQRELERKLRKSEESATKPPPIEELVAGIGRRLR